MLTSWRIVFGVIQADLRLSEADLWDATPISLDEVMATLHSMSKGKSRDKAGIVLEMEVHGREVLHQCFRDVCSVRQLDLLMSSSWTWRGRT